MADFLGSDDVRMKIAPETRLPNIGKKNANAQVCTLPNAPNRMRKIPLQRKQSQPLTLDWSDPNLRLSNPDPTIASTLPSRAERIKIGDAAATATPPTARMAPNWKQQSRRVHQKPDAA